MKPPSRYKLAVGLEYDPTSKESRRKHAEAVRAGEANPGSDQAPTVQVKGEDLVADDVVKIAKRFGVPIIENSALARALNAVEVDKQIPQELFEAVAITLNEIDKRLK